MSTLTDAHLQCEFMLAHAIAHGYETVDVMFGSDGKLFITLSIIFRQLIKGDFIQ